MKKCDIHEATHVLYHGVLYHIRSKWGVDPGNHLAKPSDGGFGCITDTGERISMWDAESYFREISENPFLSVWTVYFNPRDFPGKYVARRFNLFRGEMEPKASNEHFVANSIDEVRRLLPMGLVCLQRSDGDDAKIVETWL